MPHYFTTLHSDLAFKILCNFNIREENKINIDKFDSNSKLSSAEVKMLNFSSNWLFWSVCGSTSTKSHEVPVVLKATWWLKWDWLLFPSQQFQSNNKLAAPFCRLIEFPRETQHGERKIGRERERDLAGCPWLCSPGRKCDTVHRKWMLWRSVHSFVRQL